ncbi:MAG: ArsR/SmtB family transcription factor [Dehalococcoidia bacterium]
MAADAYEALAHPVRRQILQLLREEPELGAGDIAARFPQISRPAVSRHLAVPRRARLVHSRAHGREQRYGVDPGPVTEIYRTFFEAFLPIADRSLPNLKRMVEEAPDSGSDPQSRPD